MTLRFRQEVKLKKLFIVIVIVTLIGVSGYFFMQLYQTNLATEPEVPPVVSLVNSSTTETMFGNDAIFLSSNKGKIEEGYKPRL